eukprot:TRINITY_DN7584_c0_g1_i1.p3 TRINITY_DN7584_c0_g1~~TRINITY_DN7584_c0_g1_i1.p3  ORF type:complete len:76 (-),score=8.68 TRINITY_DN7584_c0_g1_i1:1060-1287(-)
MFAINQHAVDKYCTFQTFFSQVTKSYFNFSFFVFVSGIGGTLEPKVWNLLRYLSKEQADGGCYCELGNETSEGRH